MKKLVRLPVSSLVMSLALVIGGCAGFGQPLITEPLLTTVDDTADLSLAVKRALKNSPQTSFHQIFVTTVNEDTVKLSGVVQDDATLYEAERVAGRVDGVRIVLNSLTTR